MASESQKTFSVFHKTIKYLPSVEGRKRIPSESWNLGMNTLFTGFNQLTQIRIIVNYFVLKVYFPCLPPIHPQWSVWECHSFVRKSWRNSEALLVPPPSPRAAFTPSLLVSEIDLATTSDVWDQLMLRTTHSPNLCLPVQSVKVITWYLGWKYIAGLSQLPCPPPV